MLDFNPHTRPYPCIPPIWKLVKTGKTYQVFEHKDSKDVILYADDRVHISDEISPTIIPDKGRVITSMSRL